MNECQVVAGAGFSQRPAGSDDPARNGGWAATAAAAAARSHLTCRPQARKDSRTKNLGNPPEDLGTRSSSALVLLTAIGKPLTLGATPSRKRSISMSISISISHHLVKAQSLEASWCKSCRAQHSTAGQQQAGDQQLKDPRAIGQDPHVGLYTSTLCLAGSAGGNKHCGNANSPALLPCSHLSHPPPPGPTHMPKEDSNRRSGCRMNSVGSSYFLMSKYESTASW